MRALRALAFNAVFLAVTLVLGMAGLAVRAFARDRAFALARLWIRLTIAALRTVGGVRIEVVGRENLPRGPAVIAAQHQAGIDTLLWFTLVDAPSYVMKQELRRLPLVGGLLEPAGMIAVDRSGGAASMRSLLRAADAALARGRQIVIFPEGTRVVPGARAKLQPGIVALAGRGAPVIPVATDSGVAWGSGFLLRLSGRRRNVIHLAIGRPIEAGGTRAGLLGSIENAWRQGEAAIAAKRTA
jgi:1-acyl-sn-glycerol-3-phosphate acyltransferase